MQLTSDPQMKEMYGDPERGASLLQAWRTTQLFGSPPRACLLVAGQPRVAGAGIDPLILASPADVVDWVCEALNYQARSSVQLFVFDGSVGHSVTALAADSDGAGISYLDPWPGDSLLAKGQNAAGVEAQRHTDGWHLTRAELERVVVAAFLPPAIWSAMKGQPGLSTMAELRASEFWSFFHLTELTRDDSDPTYVHVVLQPGGFVDDIALELRHYENDEICSAELRLRQSWVLGPPMGINPFAVDLAASWLRTLVPLADHAQVQPIADEIRGLRLDEEFKAKTEDQHWASSDIGRAALAYLGAVQDSFVSSYSQTFLTIESTTGSDDSAWTRMRYTLG